MADKQQLSEEVNEALGTDMEFDRMLKDELKLLHELATNGELAEPQIKNYVKKYSKEKLDEEIDEWYPGKIAAQLL